MLLPVAATSEKPERRIFQTFSYYEASGGRQGAGAQFRGIAVGAADAVVALELFAGYVVIAVVLVVAGADAGVGAAPRTVLLL